MNEISECGEARVVLSASYKGNEAMNITIDIED